MRIAKLILFSNDLEAQKSFYLEKLGVKLIDESNDHFTVKIGWSQLTFQRSNVKSKYHYCFMIPSNKLNEALSWFKNKLENIKIEGEDTYFFTNWNAKSFYFYDGNGNLAECIARFDLKNEINAEFQISDLLCVNEIGMPSADILKLNDKLERITGSKLWKGDFTRFATVGSQEGLLLLVNNQIKKNWFPTNMPTSSEPFLATIKTEMGEFQIEFEETDLSITKINE